MIETFDEQVSMVRIRAAHGSMACLRHVTAGRAVTTSLKGHSVVRYRSVWSAPPLRLDDLDAPCRHWIDELGRQHPKLVLRLLSRVRSICVAHHGGGQWHDRIAHVSIMVDGRLTSSASPIRVRSRLVLDVSELTAADLDRELAGAANSAPSKTDAWPWPDREVRLPVVFAPGVGGTALHEVVGHGLEADHGCPVPPAGTRLATPTVTVIDDPTRPGLWGSRRIDDEGAAAIPIIMVDRGVVRDALHARETSPAASSARRMDYRSRPLARMSNTYLAPGGDDPAALLAGDAVLYCVAGGSAEVRPGSRDVSLRIRSAQLWRDGAPASIHRSLTLHFTTDELLFGIEGVGADMAFQPGRCTKEAQAVLVSHGAPTFRLARVRVNT